MFVWLEALRDDGNWTSEPKVPQVPTGRGRDRPNRRPSVKAEIQRLGDKANCTQWGRRFIPPDLSSQLMNKHYLRDARPKRRKERNRVDLVNDNIEILGHVGAVTSTR